MEDQQRMRYRLLNATLEKSDTIEQAMMATIELERFVLSGRFGGESAVQEETPAPRKRRKPKKRKWDKKTWKEDYYLEIGAEYYKKYLEAMIGLKETGQKVTMKEAGEIVCGGKYHAEKNTAVSRYLIKHGYVEKRGQHGVGTKWIILKNPDGTPYKPTILKAAPAEADGYGWRQPMGKIARVSQ